MRELFPAVEKRACQDFSGAPISSNFSFSAKHTRRRPVSLVRYSARSAAPIGLHGRRELVPGGGVEHRFPAVLAEQAKGGIVAIQDGVFVEKENGIFGAVHDIQKTFFALLQSGFGDLTLGDVLEDEHDQHLSVPDHHGAGGFHLHDLPPGGHQALFPKRKADVLGGLGAGEP